MVDAPVLREFENNFGSNPSFYIKVPGRVNLIGEHTDYNGFPVLPVAIPYFIIAIGTPRNDRTVHIRNSDPKYPQTSFELSGKIPHSRNGHWSNYVKASAQALIDYFGDNLAGMNAFFHGTVPASAGLSSSSALVIAAALAFLTANRKQMDLLALAELMAEGEHYVGTQGGGMDQAICLLGSEGNVVKIDFFPLRYTYVPFPPDYSIIVAHSLVRAAKTENALFLYNRRPAECRLATAIINEVCKPEPPLKRLGDLPETDFFKTSLSSAENFVNDLFTRESYSLENIADITGETAESITQKYLLTRSGEPMPAPPEGFLIRQRALHVFTEADRVERSCAALRKNDTETFGLLMNASHESCDRNYGISTPELNTLVTIMRSLGVSGARLTGAGFGGCAVALVHDEKVQSVIDGIHSFYYHDYLTKTHPEILKTGDLKNPVFPVKPSSGAIVMNLL